MRLRSPEKTQFAPYSRKEITAARRAWVRKNRTMLLAGSGLMAVIVLIVLGVAALFPHTWFFGFLAGLATAGFVAAWLQMLNASFLLGTAPAINALRGAWGEENTRDELRRARRKRHVWGWVDSISLDRGDIDHLVVTRRGGLVAIDSKWRTETRTLDVAELTRSADKVRLRAEAVARSILPTERGARRERSNPLAVTPVVVVWGPAQHDVPAGFVRDGVHFVGGRKLVTWLSSLDDEVVSKDAAEHVIGKLREFRATASV